MGTYEVQTEGGTYQVETADPTPWSDVPKNAMEDVKGLGKGALNLTKTIADPANIWESAAAGSLEPTKNKLSQDYESLKKMPGALFNEAKETVSHPIETFKKHPVNTALNIAGVADLAGTGLGLLGKTGKIAEVGGAAEEMAAPMAEDVSRVAESAPKPVEMPSEASNILKEPIPEKSPVEPPSAPPPPPSTPGNPSLGDFKNKIPQEILDPAQKVKEYLTKQYAETSGKPGMGNIAADYLKEHSQNMNLKEMGAAPGQVRKIGVERAHELADYANENGLVGPKIGTQGREKLIESRLEDSGGIVGAFRKMASDRGAVQNIPELTNQIRATLDQKYLKAGMYSGQKGSYMKALEELKKTDGTAQSLADKVTEMFKEAKNQNPLGKPTGPLADVARQVRQINHSAISKALNQKEFAMYEKSLEDYGALTQIREFAKRRSSTEAGGRLGPGAGISRAAVQKFLDAFGYRVEAKVAGKLADYIRKNPEAITRPKDIFRNYIDEAAEAVHEMGDAGQH